MAAPIIAASLADAYADIYVNLHSLSESGAGASFYVRLRTWRDGFFPLVDKEDQNQIAIGYWAVPTSTELSKLNVSGKDIADVPCLLNLIQNTLFATRYDGFIPDAAQEAAMVAAWNAAWT
jgi:hypothetical protein